MFEAARLPDMCCQEVCRFARHEGGGIPGRLEAFFLQNLFENMFPSPVPRVRAPARAFAYTCARWPRR
jgi:hypothetical protein